MSDIVEVLVESASVVEVFQGIPGAPGQGADTETIEAVIEDYLAENPQGGAVDSVAGKTGVVTLVKGDVGLGSVDNTADTAKPVSSAQQTALDGKSNVGHTHTAANVTDFNTAADARVAAGITGKLDTSAAPELIRDTMGTALVAGTNVTITPDDAGDTITIAAAGGSGIGATLLDAKGDLIAASANDTAARLAVGTTGQVLTPDSSQATGLKWAAPVTGSVYFEVARTGAGTTLAATSFVTYPLDGTPTFNVGGGSWNSTTFIYTVPVSGLYLCLGNIRISDSSVERNVALGIGVSNADGPHVLWGALGYTGFASTTRHGRQITRLTRFTAGDLVRMFIYSDGATFTTQFAVSASGQSMSLTKIAD